MRKFPWNGDDLIAGYFHHPRRWRYISFKIRALDVAAVARVKKCYLSSSRRHSCSSIVVCTRVRAVFGWYIISVCASLIFDSGV
jgi:hypothetical protein